MQILLILLKVRSILYAGLSPFVSLKTNFLKSSKKPTNPNPIIIIVSGSIALFELYNIAVSINNVITIIIPPIVGVPCLIKCDLGPYSLSICPTLNFFNIGNIISATIIDIIKLVSTIFICESICYFPISSIISLTIFLSSKGYVLWLIS